MPEPSEVSIWLRPERSGRGPTPGLDRDRLAAAGVALADAEGLPAVTMRAVARALGTAPASLYRYLATRDDLIELMVDRVNAEISYAGLAHQDWTADLLVLAREARGVCLRHPWLSDTFAHTAMGGPHTLTFLDHCLAALAGLPVGAKEKLEAISVMFTLVASLTRAESTQRLDTADPPPWRRAQQRYLAHAAASDGYPHLTAALRAASASPPSAGADEVFDRIITRALRGLLA
ncbi:TetR/AcrR family transcriptional regulator [Nocardia yunnanensis]|uniref:TetR/AcrR family transcriptional regulator n=1 Tax=Nocardia yunnanensis TaxID=2382165 RepID=A0A386ZBV7_9NOCA|nr:TetR/AcrR family transcriptional regulator C-terminal domain-containing protein [Nocardia yunnanensis]AYF74777.1 TetR/AcrR family transcriptional regulator [Nocardia yunnanensis]